MLTSLLSLSLALAAPADLAKTRISEAALFKNGYAVVVREVDLDKSGTTLVGELPNPTMGSFWVTASPGVKLKTLINGFSTSKTTATVGSMDELIRLNVGKDATFDMNSGGPVIGKILSEAGAIVTIQTGKGTVTVFKSAVQRVTIESGAKTTSEFESRNRVIKIVAEGAGKAYLVGLERGLTWVPAYSVDLSDPKKLKLIARATIVNDLGNLKGIPVKLITGFPNINSYGQDPFFAGDMNQVLGTMMQAGRPAGPGGFGGGMMTQNAAPSMASFDEAFGVPQNTTESDGDLSFLKLPSVTLETGERSYNILFTTESPYEHLYTWDVGSAIVNEAYTGIGGQQEVWHTIKFKNGAGQPLTTAPAMTWANGNILGQGMINYTPNGSDVMYPINKALDVVADAQEEEIDRKMDALQLRNGASYDLVKLKGTLELQNRKDEAVKVRIKKNLTGEILDGGNGTMSKIAKGLRDTNSESQLKWEQTIESGKRLTINYTYQVYVRR